MYSLIESKLEIERAQTKLETSIRREFKIKVQRNIGYPGGKTNNAAVVTNGAHWFWSESHNPKGTKNPRRLNWFGVYRSDHDLQISVEINTPFEGSNSAIAGFFARDNQTGSIYLFHTGRVGGGKKGVSRDAFLAWSEKKLIEVFDSSGKTREGVLVMPVEGAAASLPALHYVDKIAGFKKAVRAGETDTAKFKNKLSELRAYYKEFAGRRKGIRKADFDYISRHGEVVDALYEWRKSAGLDAGKSITKTMLIDLGVAAGKDLCEIYEVKTNTTRQDVYTAIGQLIVHGPTADCKRVIVLPRGDSLPVDIKLALIRSSIEVMRFELTKNTAIILLPKLEN